MDYSSREVRVSSTMRSLFIAAAILVYAWVSKQPGVSLKAAFLVAAGFQLAVIAIRRLVPPEELPRAYYILEIIADGVTVLLFALGVFGSLASLNALAAT
jgi:hypothetical protein